MRKKYLSALLFGALLLASAGTFTSCKDYDDDIKNLQEQINTVKTSLDELTTKVNNLGAGITDFKYENGQLVIVTDKDTNFTVDMPECEGIVKLEIKDGVLYADGVAVGNVTGDGGSVVEVKDGVIYIDGKAAGELGNKVAVVDNGNGTYTLTVDGKEYVLPKASSSVVVNLISGDTYFTNYSYLVNNNNGGIVWGKASNYDGKWKGLKPVVKDGLLVGSITEVSVNVLPATFDLSTAKLTLVNSLGETAPVKVTPVANADENPATAGSRAASTDGQWNLQLSMDETVTLDNIATAFATGKENSDKNIGYALAVDGKVVTPYSIVVDTKTVAEATSVADFKNIKVMFDDEVVTSNTTVLPLGEATLKLTYASASANGEATDFDKVYDAYIELTNKDYADSHEITASGMTISSTDAAAAADKVTFKVHVLDVTGKEIVSDEYTVKMASSTVEGEAIADQTCTIMPTQNYIVVDLGNTFTGLTATQAEAISNVTDASKAVKWTVADGAKSFNSDITGAVWYFASEADVTDDSKAIAVRNESTSTIRTIRYARITLTDATNGALKANAEAGDNKVTLTLFDKDANEVKKVSATVTVALPKFDDVIAANTEYALWDGNTFTTRMKYESGTATLPIENAFISKENAAGADYLNMNDMSYKLTYKDADGKDVEVDENNLSSLKNDAGTAWKANEFSATASIEVIAGQSKLTVSKDFTVKMMSLFEGAKVVYYDPSTHKVVDLASVPGDTRLLANGTDDGKGNKSGLYITIDKYEVAFKVADNGTSTFTIGGYTLANKSDNPTSDTGIAYQISTAKGSSGTATASNSGIQFTNLSSGESGTIVFTFTDNGGIQTTSEVKYNM